MNRSNAKALAAGWKEAEVRLDEPLSAWTSVRVGGPADVWLKPRNIGSLLTILKDCQKEGIPLVPLGGGANTLVGDFGVRGVVLKLPPDLYPEQVVADTSGGMVELSAGASIARVVSVMKNNGWVGAEFLAGIPGTIGGAVRMNAGTKNGECMRVVQSIEWATPDGIGWVPVANVSFQYRHTEIPTNAIVTRVRFRLNTGDVDVSSQAMDADLSYRKRTQPLGQPTFGSVFTNPPNDHAGKLIEAVGLKGHQIGQAQISTLHANWIVNLGQAQARDIVALMDLMQSKVLSEANVTLKPEVQKIGAF